MCSRLLLTRVLPALLFICVFLPNRASAQVFLGIGVGSGSYGAGPYGNGLYRYGRYPAPPGYWNYPGLAGGPYIGTGGYPFVGWPGYRGANGAFWSNGLSLYGPPVPVYGPIPGVFGNSDLVEQWRASPTLGGGFGYYGWVGPFRASPRPFPNVNAWPVIEPIGPAVVQIAPTIQSASLHLSVKVPQPAAEVFVDGVKTTQTGTDRIFESPPLEEGKVYAYEIVVRWVQGGATVEKKKTVTGKPGEVIRVDLTN